MLPVKMFEIVLSCYFI